jgi:hypothetical protein
VQATIQRVNESLIDRGYITWFDLTNMKGNEILSCCALHSFQAVVSCCLPINYCVGWHDAGSTVDAMSDAIEGADVMLYGVSLRYKESANVRAHHMA